MNIVRDKTDSNGSSELRRLKVPVITYHSIDNSSSVISTAPDIFRRQMKSISEAGYEAIPLRQLVSSFKGETRLPGKPIVLTFDDGFRNFYTKAFPVLSEYNFKATVFLVTAFCGEHNDWPGNPLDFPRSELLSWKEIRELNDHGIEFGSHTRTHRDLTKISAETAEAEVIESKAAIADVLGRETNTFAYPFGRSNAAVRQIAKAHFDAACSTNLGKVRADSDSILLNRIDSYYLANQWILEMLPSATFDNYMRLRQIMRNVKSLLARG